MRKLAVILDQSTDMCPFGLDITQGCLFAGSLVDRMTPVDSDSSIAAIHHNLAILNNSTLSAEKCRYAHHILKDAIVDCSWSQPAQGSETLPTNYQDSVSSGGVFSYPVVYENNSDSYHNPWYGNYTNASKQQFRSIARQTLYELLLTKPNNLA